MISLSFNTTGQGTEFCLEKNGQSYFLETEFSKHSETFFPLLDDFLRNHKTKLEDIDVFGVCVGPGSFTGIRIGLSVAKMFAYVFQKPCVCVTSLEVLAYNIFDNLKVGEKVCSIINAGSQNLYYQIFRKDGNSLTSLTSPKVCSFSQFSVIKEKLDSKIIYYDNDEKKYDIIELENYKQKFSAKSLLNATLSHIQNKKQLSYKEVMPIYLRVSQAEQLFIKDEIVITKGSEKDIESIIMLEGNADSDDLAWNEKAIKESFQNSNYKCFLAQTKNEVVGYVGVMDLGDEYEILRIIVSKKARAKGVGTKLLTHLFNIAKEEEKKSVVLEVNTLNYTAMLLYEKLGFCVVGNRKNYYHNKLDGLIMRKFLEE